MTTFILCSVIGLHVVGILATISIVGKPRAPMTQGQAVSVAVISGLVIGGLLHVLAS